MQTDKGIAFHDEWITAELKFVRLYNTLWVVVSINIHFRPPINMAQGVEVWGEILPDTDWRIVTHSIKIAQMDFILRQCCFEIHQKKQFFNELFERGAQKRGSGSDVET